jgi:predicted nucleotidyltransferase
MTGVRVEDAKLQFLKRKIREYLPDADIYLIGSRVKDNLRGGDIDILVIGHRALKGQEKRNIRLAFYKKLGEQKLDIISFADHDSSNFKELALLESEKI